MSQVYDDGTGRQDIASPDVNPAPSDPLPVDKARGTRMWLGITLIGIIFLAIILFEVM